MQRITQELTQLVSAAFTQCGYDAALGVVTVSNRLDLCQFQCNGAMKGAKLYKKAPLLLAQEVAACLSENTLLQTVEVAAPGFLNLTLTDACLTQRVTALARDAHLGIPQQDAGETVIIDYGGPNVAKPLHIGHLRSAIIGEALKRLARVMGIRVLGDVHLGDWGLQMGLVIAELTQRYPSWRCFQPDYRAGEAVPELHVELLSEVYPFASQKSKEDEVFKKQAGDATRALQEGHPGYRALWQEIMRVSVLDLKQNYEKLNVEFDLWYGESDADAFIPAMMAVLKEKRLLKESDGALVVEVGQLADKAPMPPVIVKKSDQSSNYATTDLATIYQRQQDFSPQGIWYVVDKRQELHLTQVFRCARKAALVPVETELSFLGFGTMNGSDGKPYKTRDGGVMQLADFLQTITQSAQEKLSGSEYVSEEVKQEVAQKLGISAVKFGDLINHRSKDYIFDLDRFLSFEGKTGVYLLYTITRITSILKKLEVREEEDLVFNKFYSDIERELFLQLLLTGETFVRALDEKAPNILCENAYTLASLFSRFYHDNHILTETDPAKQSAWLRLCVLMKKMLTLHCAVLGIETVENM